MDALGMRSLVKIIHDCEYYEFNLTNRQTHLLTAYMLDGLDKSQALMVCENSISAGCTTSILAALRAGHHADGAVLLSLVFHAVRSGGSSAAPLGRRPVQ